MSLHKSIRPEIKENYALYKELLHDRKCISTPVIDISEQKKNQKNFLAQTEIIEHISLTDEITFSIEVKVSNYKYFLFILKCNRLSERPFFHYDSDGAAHRNYEEDTTPLKFQIISTPHFNCFNENGLSIAYKTAQLENEAERTALEDISLCVAHFCNESNIRLSDENYPTISIMAGTLPYDISIKDPNKGVQFL